MVKKLTVIFFIIIILVSASISEAGTKIETKTSPNYLIILVHGINTPGWVFKGGKGISGNKGQSGSDVTNIPDSMRGFGDLFGYLSNDLGLAGYVYYYTFSYRDGRISDLAKELGDRNYQNPGYQGSKMHHTGLADQPDIVDSLGDPKFAHLGYPTPIKEGNCWLEQAKEDFKVWYASQHPPMLAKDVPDNVIPQKYILVCHSMGGLVARQYLSSNYYNNDVAAIITIDSQHLGSDGAQALKRMNDFYNGGQHEQPVIAAFFNYGMAIAAFAAKNDLLGQYSMINAFLLPPGRLILDEVITKRGLGWYPNQPGVQDMDSQGTFISNLNSKDFVKGNQPIRARFVYSGGIPTPSTNLPLSRYMIGLASLQTIFSSEYINDLPLSGKLMALYLSEVLGAVVNQNGDIYGTVKSQRGEGLSILNKESIDFKAYGMNFGNDMVKFDDVVIACFGACELANLLGPAELPTKIGLSIYFGAIAALVFLDESEHYLPAHGFAYKKVYEDKVIDHALEDFIAFGGKTNTTEVRSSISASTVSNSAEGYTAPEQTFALLSNLDNNGNTMSTYHTVTIEAFIEGGADQGQLFPIEINGQKKWVSSVTVKEYPTAFKGVIDTFLPKKLKHFNYSENFAAWKPVGEVDEWGNFTVKDMHFAEGSNVLAFDAESWIGNSANKILRVTANTVPQFVKNPVPELGASTNDVYQTIGVEANKACYSADPSEKINVISFQVDGSERLAEINKISTQETYKARTRAEWTPGESLSVGTHEVLVKFQSNVGVSQAIWSFNVDTISPAVSIGTLEAFAPRAPGKTLNIKYSTADNRSQFLKKISIRLYKGTIPDEDNNFVTQMASIDSQAVGEQFVTWDGKDNGGNYVEDGIYTIKIKAFDQAGNWGTAETQVKIDSTPPQIIEAHVSPNPATKASSEFGLSAKISEKSTVVINLTNLSEKQTTGYLTQAIMDNNIGIAPASYTWRFDDPFTPSLRDGLYRMEVIARDEAGNESLPTTLEGIRIDRTPPVIYAQYTDPFVLANVGANPYTVALRYQLSESGDVADNRQPEDDLNVKIKLYNENTGDPIKSEDVIGKLSAENTFPWNASDSSLGKGSYKFQIVAYDKYGNYSTAYATCVKDGVAPAISSPLGDSEISGTVTIRGTAMDPDWTNDRPFKQYSVYYKQGSSPATINPGPDWQTDVLEVPEIYRTPGAINRNISIRPVQNDATLAYFYTGSLTNDVYTILVVAEEDGGAKYASARTITVKNDSLSGAGANPVVNMGDIPPLIIFDGNNSLPISFTYGGKDINAYVEVLKVTGAVTRETVYYKYFPKLTANYYSGSSSYQPGNELGYFIWQDETGWHVRWNGEAGKAHRFSGSIVAMNDLTDFASIGDGVKKIASIVNWDRTMTGGEGGFDFKTASTQLIISTSLDNDPSTYNDDYSSMITPYFGMAKYQPSGTPVIISGITGQSSSGQTINWDGKVESGAFVDSGDYLVRIRAEGADGSGLTMIEKMITVTTPFELTNAKANTGSFNPLGLPDRVTVSYNVSKNARMLLKVYKEGDPNPLAIIDDGVQLGKTNSDYPHTISWRGNYPDQNGTQVVTSGEYILKLMAGPVDGKTNAIEKTILPNIKVDTGLTNSTGVQLDQIGTLTPFNGGNVYVAQGSSDYFWQAIGAGTYYPPQNYSYTLGIQGKQKASLYPYVPFAGILHRGFNKVYGKVKAKYKVHCYRDSVNVFGMVQGQAETYFYPESDYVPFEITKDNPECKITLPTLRASDWGWHQITDVDVSLEVYSNDGFLLDKIEAHRAQDVLDKNLTPYPTTKGIFNAKEKIGRVNGPTIDEIVGSALISIRLSLASSLEYSRLTNRFVPWFGFINKNHSSYEAFSGMEQYLQKLGFPGKDYFTDAAKSIDTYKKEIVGEYDHDIYDPSAYKNGGKLVKSALDSKTNAMILGDTKINAQDSYLSGEYTEFIPITTPEAGSFNYLGGIVDHYDGSRVVLKNQLTSYPIEATTNYRMVYSADNARLVELNWPKDDAEIVAQNTVLLSNLNTLINDPQTYNISNAPCEIDSQELIDRMNSFETSNPGIVSSSGWFKKSIPVDTLSLDKTRVPIDYYKNLNATLGNKIPKPDYVTDYTYQDFNKSPSNITISYDPKNQNSNITVSAPASAYGQTWSTNDDPILRDYAGGAIKGGPETFNKVTFNPLGKSDPHYFWQAYKSKYLKYHTSGLDNSMCVFWKDPSNSENLINNPNLVINSWQIALKDEAGQINSDISVAANDVYCDAAPNPISHYFQSKLKYYAKEKRYVKLTGRSDYPYELMYFDGKNWITFTEGQHDNNGCLSFWDVGRLCGKYTVLLKTAGAISAKDVFVGDPVYHGVGDKDNLRVSSVYKRAEIFFKPTSFSKDEFASVTPVTMSQIYIRNKPIITTHGPIVELKPSPYKFKTPVEGEEGRPYLRFSYTADDLKEGYGIIVSPSDPDWKTKTADLWIHQVTADGDLELVQDKEQKLYDDLNGHAYFAFEAALDHFSDYALLKGKFSLSAPMVFADSYITNKDTVTIYGSAEPGSILSLYVKTENVPPEVEKGEPYLARIFAEAVTGNYRFESVKLLQEGDNYIYVTSHLGDEKGVRTFSDVTVVKDTVPPSVEASQNLFAFSPNGDGKYDSVDYALKTNENGKIYLSVMSNANGVTRTLLNQEISAEANKEVKLTWTKESFQLYRRDNTTGNWILYSEIPISEKLADGAYNTTVYAIDEAGNISNNIISQTIVDTTPPTVLGLNADPNPFTPNDDGVKDTTMCHLTLSVPPAIFSLAS